LRGSDYIKSVNCFFDLNNHSSEGRNTLNFDS
jgi:hypothetical protein